MYKKLVIIVEGLALEASYRDIIQLGKTVTKKPLEIKVIFFSISFCKPSRDTANSSRLDL